MTPSQALAKLNELLAHPSESECVEFKTAGENYSYDKLGKYFSALSNEANLQNKACGWFVLGVSPRHKVVGTDYRRQAAQRESLKHEIARHTTLSATFKQIHEVQHPDGRVLMFEIAPAPKGQPIAFQGHNYARDGESLTALSTGEYDQIRAQGKVHYDWSAEIVADADESDLDPRAVIAAKEGYRRRHPENAGELDAWPLATFLNKAKLARGGKITRAALLLLGRAESAHKLTPADARIFWSRKAGDGQTEAHEHFGPPYLLNVDALFARLRNDTITLLRPDSLIPWEDRQFDHWVIRELLHNAIAHQDYEQAGRINVVERAGSLMFSNPGAFLPRSVERVVEENCPQDRFRNPLLCQAMINLKMIETAGDGIPKVFRIQKERGLPMPDYDLTDPDKVQVTVYGKVLDENYTRALLSKTDIAIRDVIALDRVQKRAPVEEEALKRLRAQKLVEGKRPNLRVSAQVAAATGQEAQYVEASLEDAHYKRLITDLIGKFGPKTPKEIQALLLPKLAAALSDQQKKDKVRNLVQGLARAEVIKNTGGRGAGARWSLSKLGR